MGLIIKGTIPRVPPFSSIFAMIGWKNSWHFRHTWVKWFDPNFSNLFYPIKNNIKQFPSLEYHRFFGVSMSWTLLLKLNKTKPNGAFFGPHFCQMIFTFKMASFWVATRKPMDLFEWTLSWMARYLYMYSPCKQKMTKYSTACMASIH